MARNPYHRANQQAFVVSAVSDDDQDENGNISFEDSLENIAKPSQAEQHPFPVNFFQNAFHLQHNGNNQHLVASVTKQKQVYRDTFVADSFGRYDHRVEVKRTFEKEFFTFENEDNENERPSSVYDLDDEEEIEFEEDDDEEPNFLANENKQFKLPAHLEARLLKRHQERQQGLQKKSSKSDLSTGVQSSGRVLKTMENTAPLLRRETFLVPKINKAHLLKPTTPKISKSMFIAIRNQMNGSDDEPDTGDEPRSLSPRSQTQQVQNQNAVIANEEEEIRYVAWINSVINLSFNIENVHVNLQRLINDCVLMNDSGAQTSDAQPLKDGVSSIAYKEQKLMDALRVRASALFAEHLTDVKQLLKADLDVPRFYVRKDKNIHVDVGSRKHILELFSNYNPLWLKIALECVFNTRIEKNHKSRTELHALVQVLNQKLLTFTESSKRYKYFMKEANVVAAKKHILFNFVLLIHFLDVGKRHRLIDHDPCLFRTEATLKSTRDVLIAFSREYVTGVGDITKALRAVGVHLEHVQMPIEEFNFTVTRLSIDLRDGVRLARMAEIILQRNDILPKLQFPPNSISRKLHNMEVAIRIFAPNFLTPLPKTVTAKDVCNGWRPKTIALLDAIIELYNARVRMIELQNSVGSIILLQRWWRRRLEAQDKQVCKPPEREEFLMLRKVTVEIQHRFRNLLVTRKCRADFLAQKQSAIVIQNRFRAKLEMRKCRTQFLSQKQSAAVIQQRFRALLAMRKVRSEFLLKKHAAITIQCRLRALLLMRVQLAEFTRLKQATICIQQRFLALLAMRQCRADYVAKQQASLTVQHRFRALLTMRRCRAHYQSQRNAAICIQRRVRELFEARRCRAQFLLQKNAAIVFQRRFHALLEMRKCRAAYLEQKQAALTIQNRFRALLVMRAARTEFTILKHATVVLQTRYRALLQMRQCRTEYVNQKQASITIQQHFRALIIGRRCRANFLTQKNAAITVQRRFRALLEGRKCRAQFEAKKAATIVLQRRFRALLQGRKCRADYENKRNAAIAIQQRFRSLIAVRRQQAEYRKLRRAVVAMQRMWRDNNRGNRFFYAVVEYHKRSVDSAIKIQAAWRAHKVRQTRSAIIIQSFWRAYKVRQLNDAEMPRLPIVRAQLQVATANVTVDKRLYNVLLQIIEKIRRSKSINCLYRDLTRLEVMTFCSREICTTISANHWLLQTLINKTALTNRSEPHKRLISDILGVFHNIFRLTNADIRFAHEELIQISLKSIRHLSRVETIAGHCISLLSYLLIDPLSIKIVKHDTQSYEFLNIFLRSFLNRDTINSQLRRAALKVQQAIN